VTGTGLPASSRVRMGVSFYEGDVIGAIERAWGSIAFASKLAPTGIWVQIRICGETQNQGGSELAREGGVSVTGDVSGLTSSPTWPGPPAGCSPNRRPAPGTGRSAPWPPGYWPLPVGRGRRCRCGLPAGPPG